MSSVSEDKARTVDLAVKLLGEYEMVCAADLYKLGSVMLQDLRRQLRGRIVVKCVKNTLMRIAMQRSGLEGADRFLDAIVGPNIFIFANGNPFQLAMTLSRNKVRILAKPGDIALNSIVIPAGNTGLSPGPIISKFGALGIRTRIEGGNIWVNQDTPVASAGDKISEDLADILARLGIRAAEMGLEIKAVYEGGLVIPKKELILDLDSYRKRLTSALSDAFQVALKAEYPTPETLPTLIAMAAQDVRKIAVEAEYVTSETAGELVGRAHAQAAALEKMVQGKEAKTAG